MNSSQQDSSSSSETNSQFNSDCEELRVELRRKDKIIKQLNNKIESIQSKDSFKSIAGEKYDDKTFSTSAAAVSEMMNVLENSGRTSSRLNLTEISLNESEINDERSIKLVHEGVRGLISIIKDKYVLLRQQRTEITGLNVRLKRMKTHEKDLEEVKSELEHIKQEKSGLELKLRELSLATESTIELKERIEKIEGERQMQDAIISRKLDLKEKELFELNADRDQLLQKLNNVMSSLNICKEEFDKIYSALQM